MLRLKKISMVVAFAAITGSVTVFAQPSVNSATTQQQQTDFSDNDLKQFASVYEKVQVMSQGIQQKMMEVIQEEGMDLQRFNEIQQAKMNPDMEVETTEEEDAQLAKIESQLEKIQGDFEKQIEPEIKKEMSVDKYQKIIAALQQDQELQMRLQKIMQQ